MAYTTTRVGAQTSIYSLAANQMPSIDRTLYLLKPYQTKLFQFLYFNQKAKAKVCISENAKESWFEDEYYPFYTTLSAAITGGSASEDNIGLTSATWLNVGDVLLFQRTGDLVYVDSLDSSQVDVTHLDGSTTLSTTTLAGDYVIKVGSRNHEMNTARTAVSTQEIEVYNYAEIHTETVTQSGRKQAGESWTNMKTFDDEVTKKIAEMKEEIERNWKWSPSAGSATVSTDYRHTWTKGVKGFITTNAQTYSGALQETVLDDFLASVLAKGSDERELLGGANIINQVNKIVKDKYEITNLTSKYGINLKQYQTPFGLVNITWDPTAIGNYADETFALDLENLQMFYMGEDEHGPRKFRVEEDVQTPGTDGKSSKILFDLGIKVPNEEVQGHLSKT